MTAVALRILHDSVCHYAHTQVNLLLPRRGPDQAQTKEHAKTGSEAPAAAENDLSLSKPKIDQVTIKDKRVLYRVDFIIPKNKQDRSTITNIANVDSALPTTKYGLEAGAKSFVLLAPWPA